VVSKDREEAGRGSLTTAAGWRRQLRARRIAAALGIALAAWLVLAYGILPLVWTEIERGNHPALEGLPKATKDAAGIPADPLNVALVGDEAEVVAAMLAAHWHPADPITLRSSLKIAESVVLHRPDPDAPVSPLYVFGRKQDLAFEQDVGGSADRRHHVRWWRAEPLDAAGRPLWIGDATFDRDAGISHLTGQITHHIAPDIDAERDQLMADLAEAGQLAGRYEWPGIGATQDGRNAGGDRYYTDGMIAVGVLKPGAEP
jgi:LssY C-terminus